MQEMLYPTTFMKGRGLSGSCALITDGRFSGGSAGLSVGHLSPEAAAGGLIALVEDGDEITIDIDRRSIDVNLAQETIDARRAKVVSYTPQTRRREVSVALRVYAAMALSADKGAVRDVTRLEALS